MIDIVLTVLLVLILIFVVVISLGLAHFMSRPKTISDEKAVAELEENGYLNYYETLPKNDYSVKSFDGYELFAQFIPGSVESKNYVLINHGYTSSHYWNAKYVKIYRELGFNCILYDCRGHGRNQKTYCSLGFREHKDFLCMIEDTYERYGRDIVLGSHGESMGSAIQCLALASKPSIQFVVNDCGFSSLEELIKEKLRVWFHLPKFFIWPAFVANSLLYHYSFFKVRPIDALADNRIPICFIHGMADSFISPHHSIRMWQKTKGYKEIHMIDEAEHAVSVNTDPDKYKQIVLEFLCKIGILQIKEQEWIR